MAESSIILDGSFLVGYILSIIFSVILFIIGIIQLKRRKEKQSKILAIVLLVLGIGGILSAVTMLPAVISVSSKKAAAVSVIGGADGPTSIFLAGKINTRGIAVNLVGFLFLLLGSYIRFAGKIPFLKKYDGVKDIPLYCTIVGSGAMAVGIFYIVAQAFGVDLVLLILGTIAIAIYTLIRARRAT